MLLIIGHKYTKEYMKNEEYQECPKDHTPNEITAKAIEETRKGKNLHNAESVTDLFKNL